MEWDHKTGSTIISPAKSFQDIRIIDLTQFLHSLKAGTQSGRLLERTQEGVKSKTDILEIGSREKKTLKLVCLFVFFFLKAEG